MKAVGQLLPQLTAANMRSAAAHLVRQLILALAKVDDVSQQTVRRPLDIADLDDHLRADPMDPREHKRRAEPTAAWWRLRQWHPLDGERL